MNNMEFLVARARIVRAIRAFFDAKGFVEVETAVRIPAPAPEEHIDCPPCRDGGYLRASPELQMKKLLAAGMDRIYQIGPCFREGERGSRHNPEFTMIEWYRRDATYLDIRHDLEELMGTLANGALSGACPQSGGWPVPGDIQGLCGACPQGVRALSVREAYLRYAGWDPWAGWDQDRFDFDMATKIEPAIKALGGGVFLSDYPPQAASLAKISSKREETINFEGEPWGLSPDNSGVCPQRIAGSVPSGALRDGRARDGRQETGNAPTPKHPNVQTPKHPNTQTPKLSDIPYAERWEFYWDGMELANCFTELCDAAEQRARFIAAKANRQALGESDYPLDEDFLASLPRIGSAAGVALGIDRLVMALTGATEIASVRAPL